MPTILVVEDSAVERHRVGALLTRSPHGAETEPAVPLNIVYASNGREALEKMQQSLPDVVLTDMLMPEMTGLELVEAIRAKYPSVPVVLMTSFGSEETAMAALRRGAASYVPKRNLARELVETVNSLIAVTQIEREQERILSYRTRTEQHFFLENDPSLIPPLVNFLKDKLKKSGICDEATLLRVTVALHEALVNAFEHGNLEAPSALKDEGEERYRRLLEERRGQPPYRDRRVELVVTETPTEVVYVIRDGGPGFAPSDLPDPTDPTNLERPYGRGLLLIRTFMDEVRHNEVGNEITLIKRRAAGGD